MTPFKVCCIQSPEEADMAIAAGALAVGLVGAMPNGPGPIDDERIRDVCDHVRARYGDKIWTTLLTSRTCGDAMADHVAETGCNVLQIVDAPQENAYATLRKAHPGLRLIQVIHVEDDRAVEQAQRAAAQVDVILLDSGKPSAPERTLGGTGATHDWSISKRIVNAVSTPVFLAGGLNPDNVTGAIESVRPFGVDICSGIRDRERGYALSAGKLQAFAARLGAVRP